MVQQLQLAHGWAVVDSYRVIFWAYAVMGLVKFVLSLVLSSRCEPEKKTYDSPPEENDETRPLLSENAVNSHMHKSDSKPASWVKSLLPSLSKESQAVVFKLCLLFAIDSVASGLAPASWMTYFFNRKFGLKEGSLGSLFFVTNKLS